MKLNICENDLINNTQQTSERKLYRIGNVEAIMDIGNFRKKQEDSLLISRHQTVRDIELLLVADGMGGLENGANASRIAIFETFKWFNSLENSDFKSFVLVRNKFEKFADELDEKVRVKCGSGGTTMVSALILHDSVLITNIGDSRAYTFEDGKLNQITKDHSISQRLFEQGEIKKKEDIRFHKKNNLILSRFGCEKRLLEIDYYELDKSNIDYLFLFSDGITDCVSNERLDSIIKNSEDISNSIITEALTVDSYSQNLDLEYYYEKSKQEKIMLL